MSWAAGAVSTRATPFVAIGAIGGRAKIPLDSRPTRTGIGAGPEGVIRYM